MGERMCAYTVLVGGYETLLEQPIARRGGVDLICFTDDLSVRSDTWELRPFEPSLRADPNRSSRRPKIMTHEYLPEYDVSLYLDNTVLLLADAGEIIDHFLPADSPMAVFRHSFRDTVRDEFDVVAQIGLDAGWVFDEQLAHYGAHDPESLSADALWGGMLFRRHNRDDVRETMICWWENVLRYSRRDQLSLPHALRRTGLPILVHDTDNHNSDFHCWPRMAERLPLVPASLPPGPEVVIAELEARLRTAESAAAAETAVAEELRDKIMELAADVRLRDHELAEARQAVDAATAETAAARSELGAAEANAVAVNAAAEAAAARAASRIADAHAAAAAATRRTEELLASTSWRTTAALRWVSRLGRGLRRRVTAGRIDR